MQTQNNTAWSVWINVNDKIITLKKSANSKEIFYPDKETGIREITQLLSKGYKIG